MCRWEQHPISGALELPDASTWTCERHPMLRTIKLSFAVLPVMLAAGAASAAPSPLGTWIDHTGRGAVEITDCNGALCGRIVWLKAAGDAEACNMQIIGNVKPVSGAKWDGGWIYDPERKAK